MGLGLNLTLLNFCLAFSLWLLLGVQTPFLQTISCFQDPSNRIMPTNSSVIGPDGNPITFNAQCPSITANFTILGTNLALPPIEENLYTILFGILALLIGVAGISMFTNKFPDPYSMFAVAGLFLLAYMTFPLGLFNSLPSSSFPLPLKLFLGGYYGISYLITFLGFYKGGDF